MVDSDEEFEPLFDYSRVQPSSVVCLDDSLDDSPVFISKRPKLAAPQIEKKEGDLKVKDVNVISCDDDKEDEEDWLPPPPKKFDNMRSVVKEDSTLKALRLKRQELESLFSEDVMRKAEESARKDLNVLTESPSSAIKQPVEPSIERTKLVISIQDKDGPKQFRVFADDKFERLFKMYADRNNVDVKKLVFAFDGDKISPAATPDSLGMEDEDIIEVHLTSN